MATISYKQTGYAVLELLKRRTDENHRLKQVEIVALLEKTTGVAHARKSIHKDLKELQDAGYPVRFHHGWYYEHEFCQAELNLLIDTLRCTAGITSAQRGELVCKISKLGGEWYAAQEQGSQRQPANPQFLYTLDVLHEAIAKGKQVTFFYGNYGVDKLLHRRCRADGKPRDYLINPYYVLTTNGRYYLICNVDKYDTIAHFRIERVMDIRLLDSPAKGMEQLEGAVKGIDVQQHLTDHPYMYPSEAREFHLQIIEDGINDVLDWLGMDTRLESKGEGIVEAIVVTDDVSLELWKRRYAEYLVNNENCDCYRFRSER